MAECCAADEIEDITVILKREEHQDFGFHILGGKDAPYLPYDNGIYVSKIVSDSVADRDGNLAPGDKILSTAINERFENSTSDSDVLDQTALSEEHDDDDDDDDDAVASMKNGSVMQKKFQCLDDESSSNRFYTKIVQRFTNLLPTRQFLFFGIIPLATVVLFTILVRCRKNYR
ncbi:Synaptojanin-2-binding protein [Trichinella pseudospiralis]|uniref:Synaptojanin-2-binding protein n=1 Tax=Trichinella pseudospiralis TaxID=6337 RepID=A0A0V0YBX4_TRIPS|nr:Synaptojanin-2-binding protein [Trichinella pseudospiralis]